MTIRIVFLSILINFVVGCNSAKDNCDQALEQTALCLNAKHSINLAFNKRNPYFANMAKSVNAGTYEAPVDFMRVDEVNDSLTELINHFKKKITRKKKDTSKSGFYEATLEYIDAMIEFNSINKSFLEYARDTLNPREAPMSHKMIEYAHELEAEQKKWMAEEAKFYQENNITQAQLDSIVRIIKDYK